MQHHWEIAWTSLRPLGDEAVRRAVVTISRLGCSWPQFVVDAVEDRYVRVRHRGDDEFVLELGFAADSPAHPYGGDASCRGLVDGDGLIAWNWCCTGRAQPETSLILRKWREVQAILDDNLIVWDDDGMCHWSWGSSTLERAGLDPISIVDSHLRSRGGDARARRAS